MRSKKLIAIKILFFIICCCFLVSIASPVLASGDYEARWSAYGAKTGKILKTLAMAGGALGIAYCAIFEYMLGDESTASKGLNKILMIIGAEIAIFILPYIIDMVRSGNGMNAWTP